jgi:hypothetical protein
VLCNYGTKSCPLCETRHFAFAQLSLTVGRKKGNRLRACLVAEMNPTFVKWARSNESYKSAVLAKGPPKVLLCEIFPFAPLIGTGDQFRLAPFQMGSRNQTGPKYLVAFGHLGCLVARSHLKWGQSELILR